MHDVRPIDCDRTRLALSVALDEPLSAFELTRAAAHVRECEACRLYEARVELLTDALRSAPPERLPAPVRLPARTLVAWRSAARVASVGAAAAVALVALVSLSAAPERSALQGTVLALDSPAGTNELLIDIVRPRLISGDYQALAYGAGGIGAYKPPLEPGV